MIELKDYQIEAIDDLKANVEKCIKSSDNKVCIFQAPTGSGKTLMVSELLRELIQDRKDDLKFSFIWISVRMLHEQSKEKLEKYYENDRLLQCSYFEDLEHNMIGENEILFVNWSSINKKEINIYVRDNEQDNNLSSIIQNTKDEGRDMILIIDESHHTANSEKSRELIQVISPRVTIEVSATPQIIENICGWVNVPLDKVKSEEMIKSEISVNPEFSNIKIGSKSADELVIEQALKKREELSKYYANEKSSVNPLVLIQLPDQKGALTDKKDEILKILKDKFKITENNGKLAVWLSEEKTETLANMEKNDNEVQVLVFKQAPALGWDCPRASILVIFRETKSFVFTIQTIGRIMRMPELKYYDEPELNKGFVFTNLEDIHIAEDYAKDYVTIYEAKRDDKIYKPVDIPSIYLKRMRERTRLVGAFAQIFSKVADEMDLAKKITESPSKIVNPIIADGRIVDVDKSGEIEHKGTIEVALSLGELQQRFDRFIVQNCTPYAPAHSSDRMKTALYQFFSDQYKIEKLDPKAQRIVLGKENIQAFVDAINNAKEKYKREVVEPLKEKSEIVPTPKWNVPLLISYNGTYTKEEKERSVMKPFYSRKPSEPERLFVNMLEDSESKVKWWFRNGQSEIKYFAVRHVEDGVDKAFYVDFIVYCKDGSIGLFDTKKGYTAKEAKSRAEALQKYIKDQNKKGKNLWGGIAIYVNGSWRYNHNEVYEYDPNNLSDWEFFKFES